MRPLLISLLISFSITLSAQEKSASQSYSFAEQMPEYPGGEEVLKQFIKTNLRYPEYEKQNKIEGRVVIAFLVSETGTVTNASVIKSVSPGLDKEALRLVNSLDRFIPGMLKGKPVAVKYVIPVTFKL